MTVRAVIEAVEALDRELVVSDVPAQSSIPERLADAFETRTVTVRSVQTASRRPAGVGVLSDDGGVRAVLGLEPLRVLAESHSPDRDIGRSDPLDVALGSIEEALRSRDTRGILITAREIEDRALVPDQERKRRPTTVDNVSSDQIPLQNPDFSSPTRLWGPGSQSRRWLAGTPSSRFCGSFSCGRSTP